MKKTFYVSRDTNTKTVRFWNKKPSYDELNGEWCFASTPLPYFDWLKVDSFKRKFGWIPREGKCVAIESSW